MEEGKYYVFLIVNNPDLKPSELIDFKLGMLELACCVAMLKFDFVNKAVGIAIEAPNLNKFMAPTFIFLPNREHALNQQSYFEDANKEFGFFESKNLQASAIRSTEFSVKT